MNIAQLEKYAALKMEAQNNEERILQAFNETQIPAMKQGDGSQRTAGAGDRQEKTAISYIEIKDRLQPQVDANKAEMRKIEDAVNSLEDGLQREVLRLRYIDTVSWRPVPWRIVAIKIYKSDAEKYLQQVQRIHRKAKVAFQNIS